MAKLIAKSACDGLLPLTLGEVTLSEVVVETAIAIAPHRGQAEAVGVRLTEACGVGFPAAGRMLTKAGVRIVWVGQGRALLIGAEAPDLAGLAAVTEQGDGLAIVQVEGEAAEAVLARLAPVDLRAATFKRGHTARSMIAHMMASITRTGANSFEVMVMRSMGKTLVHDLSEAAIGVAARG